MDDPTNERELRDRLRLIEHMIAEGRRTTERWGWTFVLWGVAFYAALAWSQRGQSAWAWPVTMIVAGILTGAIASRSAGGRPATTLGRAINAIWAALGITMFLLFFALGAGGRLADPHVFFAAASAFLGMANGASGLLLRWKAQLGCAVIWWVAAIACSFGSAAWSTAVFLGAILLGLIVFGIYCMAAEAGGRKRRQPQAGPAHV
ncbi:MAG: hypothetical protein ACRD1A_11035 [Terriglobales bacterium]